MLFEPVVSRETLRPYPPALASDTSKSWRLIGLGETHCAMENGFNRVYMRWEF